MGAWIEIVPSIEVDPDDKVAPRVGAWIEISAKWSNPGAPSRTPCGCVD